MDYSISVVIPTHNRPNLLHRAVESVLSQTVPVAEILIVDDLDDSKTKELCLSFENSLIRYVPNMSGRGASSSRNLGVSLAVSNYVAFLDDDDLWLPEKIEKQIKMIRADKLDACFSQMLIKYENTDIVYSTRTSNSSNPKREILFENFIGGTISAIIKRDLLLEVGSFDEEFKAREEYDLWIRIIHSGAQIGVVEEPLTVVHRSLLNDRTRVSSSIDTYISAVSLLNKKHDVLIEKFLDSKDKKYRMKKQYDFLGAQAASIGLKKEAVKYYGKSLLVKPSLKSLVGFLGSIVSPKVLIKLREKLS